SARTRASVVKTLNIGAGRKKSIRPSRTMMQAPRPSAVHPASRARRLSRAPTACPTRTAPAEAVPSGTMKTQLTMFSAIWCEADETASSRAARAVASANTPTSRVICEAAGAPSATRVDREWDVRMRLAAPPVLAQDGEAEERRHVEAGDAGGPRGAGDAERGH